MRSYPDRCLLVHPTSAPNGKLCGTEERNCNTVVVSDGWKTTVPAIECFHKQWRMFTSAMVHEVVMALS
eukprot:5824973-Amphidinium_carterae.1